MVELQESASSIALGVRCKVGVPASGTLPRTVPQSWCSSNQFDVKIVKWQSFSFFYEKCENLKEKQDVLLKIILRKWAKQVKCRRSFQQQGQGIYWREV